MINILDGSWISLKVIKDSTTPKHEVQLLTPDHCLKVIKDSTTPKRTKKECLEAGSLKVIKDSTTPKPL